MKLDSGGLKSKAHLLGLLQGGPGIFPFFAHAHPPKLCNSLSGFGSVIQVRACVAVTK